MVVIERQCHRCGTEIYRESEGALTYCFHCGAPQIFLSEELQEQAQERQRLEQQSADQEGPFLASPRAADGVGWKQVIKLSLVVSGVLAALSLVLPPLGFLVFAWAPVAPAIVISLYATRARNVRFSSGIGARVGLICGCFIALALALMNTLLLDILRFGLHRSDLDTSVNTLLAQVRTQTIAQSGPQAADVFNLLSVPELRAGFFIAGFGCMAAIVLLLATGGGAIAGGLQKRRRISQ